MVTLYNKHNIAAQFSWTPVVGKEGTAFSVRPARGIIINHYLASLNLLIIIAQLLHLTLVHFCMNQMLCSMEVLFH